MLRNHLDIFIRVRLFSFLWLQLMMLATLMLRWHQLKWKRKKGRKACKRMSTQNPRPLWNSWQNFHPSLKKMERSLLGMLQWVRQSFGLWIVTSKVLQTRCHCIYVSLSHLWLSVVSPDENDFYFCSWIPLVDCCSPKMAKDPSVCSYVLKFGSVDCHWSFSEALTLPYQPWIMQLIPAVAV